MPSNPTRAEIEAQWRNAAEILEKIADAGSADATNLVDLIDTFEQSLESDFAAEAAGAMESLRSDVAGTISPARAQAILRPFVRAYCQHVIGRKDVARAGDLELLSEIYDYRRRNALFVQSRVITFGSPSAAAGNIGTAKMARLTKDRWNFDIEASWVDQKRVRCVLDSGTGMNVGEETWLIEGQSRLKDELRRSGSGFDAFLSGQTVSQSLLENAGFQAFGNTAAAPTSITNWTSSAAVNGTNYLFDSANTFRRQPQVGPTATQYSLRVGVTTELTQKLTVSGNDLRRDTPYIFVVVWKRDTGAASGTLVLRMGNVSRSITVAAQAGWNVSICPSTLDLATWYEVFAEEDVQFDIGWTRTGGNLHIAEALLLSGSSFDNHWYWMLPNDVATYVPPRIDDEFTITDTGGTTGLINKWNWKAWNVWFPLSNGSSISWVNS